MFLLYQPIRHDFAGRSTPLARTADKVGERLLKEKIISPAASYFCS
jgi:hypothetical protein